MPGFLRLPLLGTTAPLPVCRFVLALLFSSLVVEHVVDETEREEELQRSAEEDASREVSFQMPPLRPWYVRYNQGGSTRGESVYLVQKMWERARRGSCSGRTAA